MFNKLELTSKTQDMETKKQRVIDNLKILSSIELLEYHNKNLLNSPKFVNEQKRELLSETIEIIENQL